MKKYKNIIIYLILLLFLQSCDQKILDKAPLDRYSDGTVWTDPNLAEAYLSNCYNFLPHGFWPNSMAVGYCDEGFLQRGSSSNIYMLGDLTPDNITVRTSQSGHWFEFLSWSQFPNLQRINIFLENIDKIADLYAEPQKTQVKAKTDLLEGEALFLRAWIYTELCRTYGGVPIMQKANKLGDDFSGITRASFEETVNFIVKDCDDAAALLNEKSETVMGQATKEAALALKSRILLFAASDLTADGTAGNELVGYANPNRSALWAAARDAAKAVIDLGTCELADFGAPDQKTVAIKYQQFFEAQDLSNDEVIWGKMFRDDIGTRHQLNRRNGPNGTNEYSNNGPLQSMVDTYEMKDGSKFFNHFTIVSDNYKNNSAKFHHESPYYDREPRFYGSVLYDSAVWKPRFENLQGRDPLGIYDRRTRIKKVGGTEISKVYGIDTRNGPISPNNGAYGGYIMKKFMDDEVYGALAYSQNIWIWLRYAEVILNYAEACIGTGDIATATTYINMIRNRAGLPDFTGDITQALRYERKVELFAEEIRWFDIRRWKILEEVLTPPLYGIDVTEINNDGIITTTWKRIVAQQANKPKQKMYWMPIQTSEINRAPQLEQTPGF